MSSQKWSGDKFSEDLGRRLKTLRDDKGLTQEEAAEALSARGIPMTWTQLARLEKGSRSLRAVEAVVFADLFGISVDRLLGRRARPQADLMQALRAALDAKEQTRWAVSSHQQTLGQAAGELADADTGGRYAELVADFENACRMLDAATQAVASIGATTNPQTAAAIKQGTTAILRQWLNDQEAGK